LYSSTTLGRSRSLSGNKRQPIRFVRESPRVLSTFSATATGSVGPTDDNKYKTLFDEDDDSRIKCLERPSSTSPRENVDISVKYNTIGGSNRSFSVSKYIQHKTANNSPSPSCLANEQHRATSDSSTGSSDSIAAMTCAENGRKKSEGELASVRPAATTTVTSQRGAIGHVTFRKFDADIDRLVHMLNDAASATSGGDSRQSEAAPSVGRCSELLILTRRFVGDSQRMVSSAAGSTPSTGDLLATSVHDSLSTLSLIVEAAVGSATGGVQRGVAKQPSPRGLILLGRVRDLVETFRATVWTARSADGQPFDSVEMKTLVTQATSLAAMLGSMIRMLSRVS
jgi:hypothetical protein